MMKQRRGHNKYKNFRDTWRSLALEICGMTHITTDDLKHHQPSPDGRGNRRKIFGSYQLKYKDISWWNQTV